MCNFQSRHFEIHFGKSWFQPAIRSGVNPEQTVLWKPTIEALKLNIDILYSLRVLNSASGMDAIYTYECQTWLLPFVLDWPWLSFSFTKDSIECQQWKFMSWRLLTVTSFHVKVLRNFLFPFKIKMMIVTTFSVILLFVSWCKRMIT